MNQTNSGFVISMDDPLTNFLIQLISVLIGAVASIVVIIWTVLKIKDRRPRIRIGRFPEPHTDPPIWKIRIHYSNKLIENCNVWFGDKKLVWDGRDSLSEFTIVEGGQKNLTIPQNIFNIHSEVVVKSGNHTIKSIRFDRIPLESA